ncbi:MAG: hypothetical protein WBW46_02410, partial [Candidatus Sulfotelmatobacter sp.]
ILLESGLLGMPPNGSKIRRGEAPQLGVACENPSLESETAHFTWLHTTYFKIRNDQSRFVVDVKLPFHSLIPVCHSQ